MSRSRKKFPRFNQCCGTDTEAHRMNRRIHRRIIRVQIRKMDPEDFDAVDLPNETEVPLGDPWSWPSDGRYYSHRAEPKDMRK